VPHDRVSRFDVAGLGKPERTSQGFLRIPAFLTRAGVLEYKRADGTVVRELRPPDEVFHARSLSTLSAAPVTDLHPTAMISPSNVRELAIGHVSDSVKPSGELVEATVTVQHADAIAAVERGERRELSCGYQCRIDATPGTYRGERYDQVQRDIVYNHVALGPRNWGRAGRDVALRVDSATNNTNNTSGTSVVIPGAVAADVFRLDSHDALSFAVDDRPKTPPAGDRKMDPELVTLRVDGLDVQLPKQAAQIIEKAIATRDDGLKTAKAKHDELQGRFDANQAELAKTKTERDEARDPKRLDAAVNTRAALVDHARRVLPAETKLDGLANRAIQEAVLKHLHADLELKDKSDEYVGARFDHAMTVAPSAARNAALDEARRVTGSSSTTRAERRDSAPYVPPWRRPLSISKDKD
jgi:hypothetical protein